MCATRRWRDGARAVSGAARAGTWSLLGARPTSDALPVTGTRREWFELLERELPEQTLDEMRAGTQFDMILYHHGLGTWIRNRWRAGDPIPREARGLNSLDDMSGLLLEAFWCHLRGAPISIRDASAQREDHCRRMSPQPPTPPGYDAKLEGVVVHVTMRMDGTERYTHIGRCASDGTVWAWELDRGWFRPEPELLDRVFAGRPSDP